MSLKSLQVKQTTMNAAADSIPAADPFAIVTRLVYFGYGLWIMGLGFVKILVFALWLVGFCFVFWALCFGVWVSGFCFQALGFSAFGFGLFGSAFGFSFGLSALFQTLGFRFLTSGLRTIVWTGLATIMGELLVKKWTCLYFLDKMSVGASSLVHLSCLKIKTRLFLDQQLTL